MSRGCELPTNLQNFTQKDNRNENIPKSFRGDYYFW